MPRHPAFLLGSGAGVLRFARYASSEVGFESFRRPVFPFAGVGALPAYPILPNCSHSGPLDTRSSGPEWPVPLHAYKATALSSTILSNSFLSDLLLRLTT